MSSFFFTCLALLPFSTIIMHKYSRDTRISFYLQQPSNCFKEAVFFLLCTEYKWKSTWLKVGKVEIRSHKYIFKKGKTLLSEWNLDKLFIKLVCGDVSCLHFQLAISYISQNARWVLFPCRQHQLSDIFLCIADIEGIFSAYEIAVTALVQGGHSAISASSSEYSSCRASQRQQSNIRGGSLHLGGVGQLCKHTRGEFY